MRGPEKNLQDGQDMQDKNLRVAVQRPYPENPVHPVN
jgi:hypothetical protein